MADALAIYLQVGALVTAGWLVADARGIADFGRKNGAAALVVGGIVTLWCGALLWPVIVYGMVRRLAHG